VPHGVRAFNTASLHTTWQRMVELQDVNGRASCNLPAITSLGVDPCLHIVHATGSLLQGVPASAFTMEELARVGALLVSCILYIHSMPKSHAHYLENFVWDGRDPVAIFSGAQLDLILSHLRSAPQNFWRKALKPRNGRQQPNTRHPPQGDILTQQLIWRTPRRTRTVPVVPWPSANECMPKAS
jgi:hypothetical protein